MTIKLYKFRSLGDCISAIRIKEIIDTGKFWCSSLWEQNDSMEGVYSYWKHTGCIDNIFSKKNKYRICSFSGEKALRNPRMWGHYANGLKGLAIEIEVEYPTAELFKVVYCDAPNFIDSSSRERVQKIITSKLKYWEEEEEYRLLKEGGSGSFKFGKITAVYFGNPYCCTDNYKEIVRNSPEIQRYLKLRKEIETSTFGKFPRYYASLGKHEDEWKLTWEPMNT